MGRKREREDLLLAAALALASAALYLSLPSRAYMFEGLFWAMPIELGAFRRLTPGNYILYGLVGYAFHGLAVLGGYSGLAVHCLQAMDGLFGAAGLGVFFLALRTLGVERAAAGLWSGVLGCCLGYWSFSAEAESYIFGTFLLEVNFYFLARYAQGRGSPALLGALQALAIAGHIVNSVFIVVPLWFLYARHGKAWRGPALVFTATAAALAALSYACVLLFIVRPPDLVAAWHWFLGSADTREGLLWWHGGGGLPGLLGWLKMTVNVFTSFQPPYASPAPWPSATVFLWSARVLLAAFALRLAARGREFSGAKRAAAIGCGLWLAAYACVFLSWEPSTMVYRVSDLVPLCVLLCLGAEQGPRRMLWRAAAAGLWASLLIGNLGAEIYPRAFASNNPHLARMDFVAAHTAPGDWIAGAGGRDELYLPCFARRRPLIVGLFQRDPARLARRVNEILASGDRVYVASDVLRDGYWGQFFARFRPEEAARDAGGFALYRLTRASPAPILR